MELWTEIRRRVLTEEISKRQACREYDLHWQTLRKILEHPDPPGYRMSQPRAKRKLDEYLTIIHQVLKEESQASSNVRRPQGFGKDYCNNMASK